MNDFTASNGVSIQESGPVTDRGPWLVVDGDLLSPNKAAALREAFRAEEDARLGRWRWRENQDVVVYPHPDDSGWVTVLHETRAQSVTLYRKNLLGHDDWTQPARAYFDAHPEPKLWHDAKPGEVWALTIDGQESAFYPSKSLDRAFTPVAPNSGTMAVQMDSPLITAGRRIYPGASS